jgi:iron(III) transport system permease protein
MDTATGQRRTQSLLRSKAPSKGSFIMAALIIVFGFYVLYPVLLIFINSFNIAHVLDPPVWSLDNWRAAFSEPDIFTAIGHTFLIFGAHTVVSFPIAVTLAWLIARTNLPGRNWLEFAMWVSFMMPQLATTIGWSFLLDPYFGFLNQLLVALPLIDSSPFNIYSVQGIVFAHLVGNSIALKVMLLTPAFRNMDTTLEEAGRVSGATTRGTMFRVTLPLMIPAMSLVLMLNLIRIFQSFEIEQILGRPIDFFVYSSKIYSFIRFFDPPEYGMATALGAVTLILVAIIIPVQRWLLTRKNYVTMSGNFKPGTIDLRGARWPIFAGTTTLAMLLTVVPFVTLLLGSFMTRIGFFEATPMFTLAHWDRVVNDPLLMRGAKTTLFLGLTTAIISPILFSMVGYVLVRTAWKGRAALDTLFWISSSIPGILASLGLLWVVLGTSWLVPLYGTIYVLMLVMILQGKLLSTQMTKAVYVQMGSDMEEAARVAGAGWIRTYIKVWLPLMMPTLVLIGTLNFVFAAQTTSAIILLSTSETRTLAVLALEMMSRSNVKELEAAGIISLMITFMTLGVALVLRKFGLTVGVRQDMKEKKSSKPAEEPAAPGARVV